MICDIILSKEEDKYIARAKEWPEITVIESSRDEAIEQIKSQLFDYLTNKVEVVQVNIPLSMHIETHCLNKFGWFKDDPTFDDLQAEIKAYRQELGLEMENETE